MRNQYETFDPTPLWRCVLCADLMARRSDHLALCIRCREKLRRAQLWLASNGTLAWPKTTLPRHWALDFDDVLRPFWRDCQQQTPPIDPWADEDHDDAHGDAA